MRIAVVDDNGKPRLLRKAELALKIFGLQSLVGDKAAVLTEMIIEADLTEGNDLPFPPLLRRAEDIPKDLRDVLGDTSA